MADKGLSLQMSTLPNVTFIQRDTGEICTFTIEELLQEYDFDRREKARARKAEQPYLRNQARKRLVL
jgi:hypothetical protein